MKAALLRSMSMGNGKRVVVVTGGTAGIGKAAALAFARTGASVAVLGRDAERVREAVKDLGMLAEGWAVDVGDAARVEAVAREIEQRLGPIDVWVNNAMTTVFGRCSDLTPEDYAAVTATTYLGTVYGTLAALELMRRRNRGVIVQVGSGLAYQAVPLQSAYSGAKHAMRGFTNALRAELRAEGSRVAVTQVHLSAFNTPQFDWARSYLPRHPRPIAPVFDPKVAADAIVRAAARPKREYFVGWPAAKVIWAGRLVPGLAERLAARTAIDGQMDRVPTAGRTGNLEEPVPGASSVYGRFGAESRANSWQWSLAKHRNIAIAGGLLAVVTTTLGILLV